MRYPKSNGYRNKYGLTRYEQSQVDAYDDSLNESEKSATLKIKTSSFLSIVFILLFAGALISTLSGITRVPTFRSLLSYLTSAPRINMSSISAGISNFVNNITNIPIIGSTLGFIATPIGVVIYLALCVINAVLLISWAIGWFFGI